MQATNQREHLPRRPVLRDLTMARQGLGWAASAVVLAATVVIAIVAPV